MVKTPNNQEQPDFQGTGEQYLKKVEYDEKTAAIHKRLTVLESKVKDNDSFAKTFNDAFVNSKKLDATVQNALVTLIKSNPAVKNAIIDKVNESDRDWVRKFMKRIGLGVWTIIIAVISGAIVYFVKG